jgi:hypothetical protein
MTQWTSGDPVKSNQRQKRKLSDSLKGKIKVLFKDYKSDDPIRFSNKGEGINRSGFDVGVEVMITPFIDKNNEVTIYLRGIYGKIKYIKADKNGNGIYGVSLNDIDLIVDLFEGEICLEK